MTVITDHLQLVPQPEHEHHLRLPVIMIALTISEARTVLGTPTESDSESL